MLIQRPECTTPAPTSSSPEDLIHNKMQQQQQQQQQQHIKRLLSTAAAATGIVGDVDAPGSGPAHFSQKPERNLWRLDEIKEVLNIMQQINALELLNDKSVKSEKVFRNIEQMMHRKGFRKKSHAQIWTKWKFLKSTYMTSRRNRVVPKMIPFEIYQILHKMLNSSFGMSAGNSSAASLDGDNSNCEENLLTNASNASNASNFKSEQNELGHPIFGFRLGLVKSEPVDTGYETTANNSAISEADSLDENVAFITSTLSPGNSNGNATQHSFMDIKEERVTDSPAPSSPLLVAQIPLEEPPRPVPKNTKSMSITPVTSSGIVNANKPTTSAETLPLPPLRIAPFANERNMNEALRRLDHSPPPLAMSPLALAAANHTSEENATTFIRKMLRNSGPEISNTTATIPPASLSPIAKRPSVLRLPKEVTLQLRSADIDANATRTTQMPTRQTYSLRTERTVLTTNDILPVTIHQTQPSLLHSNKSKNLTPFQQNVEQPTTSQMASQIHAKAKSKTTTHTKQKKRRLNIPSWNDYKASHHTKITRSSLSAASDSQHQQQRQHLESHNSDESYSAFKIPEHDRSSPDPETSTNRKQRAVMDEMLKELAMSLQQAQLKMIDNFFECQMEITRQEHEYQMKQDQLIMEAFQEQTRQLMNSASQVFGLNIRRTQNNVGNSARKTNANHKKSQKTGNGSFERNKATESSIIETTGKQVNNTWQDEHNYSSSECMEDEPDNDAMEAAVDPILLVTSELIEEYDNS